MTVMSRLRAYHALLAVLVIAAFLSSEWGRAHAWLGYGVAGVIVLRLILALTGAPQLGLRRFYPQFRGMKLDNAFTHPAISRVLLIGIAVCLLGVTGTGIAMDSGRTFGAAPPPVSQPARGEPQDLEGEERGEGPERDSDEDGEGGPLAEIHEFLGNSLIFLVASHIAYLLLFKRPLARFMLFATVRPSAK